MARALFCTVLIATLAVPVAAQTPGVTELAPGVQQIDGAKVPSLGIDTTALEAVIKEKRSFRAVRKLLQGDGITSVGPGNTTVHMYKVHDTVSGKDQVLILFVKGDEIVDHLLT